MSVSVLFKIQNRTLKTRRKGKKKRTMVYSVVYNELIAHNALEVSMVTPADGSYLQRAPSCHVCPDTRNNKYSSDRMETM